MAAVPLRCILTLLVSLFAFDAASAQGVTANGSSGAITVYRGATINVGADSGSTSTDWVGLYAIGAAHGSYQDWWYLNGAKSAPGSPVANASFAFSLTLAPAGYELRKFHNNGYTVLGTSGVITVQSAALKVNGIQPPDTVVSESRATIQVDAFGGPGHTQDWVGVYRPGAADNAWLDWVYLNGLRTVPSTGLHSASFTMTLPVPRGPYELAGSTPRAATTGSRPAA